MTHKPSYKDLENRIRELEHSESLNRKSHEKFLTVLDSIDATIYVADMKTYEILFMNKHMIEGFGRDMTGDLCFRSFRKETAPCSLCTNDRLTDEKGLPAGVHVWQDKNPITDKFYINYDRAIEWTDGKLVRLQVATDITDQKKAEAALVESEEKYRKLVNTSPYGIQLTDPDGKILFSNPAHHRIQGYPDGELVGKYIWDLMADESRKSKARAYYQKIIKNRPAPEVYFSRDKNKNGKEIDVRINWDYVYDSKGEIEGIISILTDITDQKILEARLQQAQKMEAIGTLAGGIAHDFNNILFPIIGHTEMLMEDAGEDSPLREGLKEIYAGALRAGDLVGQILTFSRQGETELRRMKLQPIINEALKLLRATLPSTISLRKNLQADCGAVKADPTQIHQIVMNLSTNAYHAMEEQGGDMNVQLAEIELKESDLMNPDMTPGKYACLSVSDNGKGIDNPIINKIFDPFFTTKEKGKGTGMGLSVVHGIVNAMKGGIRVESVPGRGTAFHIYLPIVRTFPEDLESETAQPAAVGSEKILLVDDEEAIIAMEKMILERLGYQVTSCSGSIEALEDFRLTPEKYDLVITDMTMPKLTGDNLAMEMLKIRPDIPILICTGFSETLTEEKLRAIGVKGILMKPVVIKKLAEKLRYILDGKKWS